MSAPAPAARIEAIGAQHGFALDAARAMAQAVAAGGGGMAQFDHPALGGTGQWMRGGMVMIGDMFNRALAARVGALADDLAGWLACCRDAVDEREPEEQTAGSPTSASESHRSAKRWWPADLGEPDSSGSQNAVRYAYFADAHRLAVAREGSVDWYDTGEHRLGGVSQSQASSRGDTLQFSSQHGAVDLASLHRLQSVATDAVQPDDQRQPAAQITTAAPGASSQPVAHGVLDLLPKLADLHARGVLSDDEFTTKKSELLGRI